MTPLNLLLKLFIFFVIVYFILKTGFRFLFWIFSLWYITIPLAIALYLILFLPRKKKVKRDKKTDLDPSKEIKLDKEPEFKDLDSESRNNKGEEK